MRGIIYKYKCLINGKVYIGQTINEHKRKWSHQHCCSEWRSHFYNAIKKYGYNNFTYEVLYEVISEIPGYVKQILDLEEKYFIFKYKSTNPKFGYNITAGGGGTLGLKCSESHRRKMSIIMKSKHLHLNENQIRALKYANEHKKPTHAGKAVLKYSINGIFIEEFDSIKRAAASVNGNQYALATALNREHGKGWFKNYYWKYKGDTSPINIINPRYKNAVSFNQYSQDGELLNSWHSYNEAARFFNKTPSGIKYGIIHNPTSYLGYKWSFTVHNK